MQESGITHYASIKLSDDAVINLFTDATESEMIKMSVWHLGVGQGTSTLNCDMAQALIDALNAWIVTK